MTKWMTGPVLMLLCGPTIAADVKEDKGDAAAKETVQQFFKGLQAKDLDAVLKTAEVPFLFGKDDINKDAQKLKERFQQVLKEKDFTKAKIEIVEVGSIEKIEEKVGKKLPEDRRKPLTEVLGKEYRLVLFEIDQGGGNKDKGALGIRLTDGKGKVVAIVD